MTDADSYWSISNPGPDTLRVWLEPWAEELEVQVHSTLTLIPKIEGRVCALGEVEWTADYLVVWATAQIVEPFIDGIRQDTASGAIPVPAGLTKAVLAMVLTGHTGARLGGEEGSPGVDLLT